MAEKQNTATSSGKNAQSTNTQNARTTLSRSEIIQRNTERKKRVIDQNTNAAVFVSDSKAGTQIFFNLRMIDSLDSAIRRVWGDKLEMSEVEVWFSGLREVQDKLNKLQDVGMELLVKADSPRDINNRILRNAVVERIATKKKIDNPPEVKTETKEDIKATTKKK
ncbi:MULTISPECIES: hypothetical protein [unclassified Campylobacter]|uniref:hypothetical protein n=1 Tax=unclassified Campylobacter TaxID=2593542 RepID=UPI00163C64CC|nr:MULTISPECIES: hypothetical protein [unclassified Campylobacter]